jgi:hypothetical protein
LDVGKGGESIFRFGAIEGGDATGVKRVAVVIAEPGFDGLGAA